MLPHFHLIKTENEKKRKEKACKLEHEGKKKAFVFENLKTKLLRKNCQVLNKFKWPPIGTSIALRVLENVKLSFLNFKFFGRKLCKPFVRWTNFVGNLLSNKNGNKEFAFLKYYNALKWEKMFGAP